MKKICLLLLLCFTVFGVRAQNIKLKLVIANTTTKSYRYYVHNPPLQPEPFDKQYSIDSAGRRVADIVLNFDKPQKVTMYFWDGKSETSGFNYAFFLTPGDDILFDLDFKRKEQAVITGKGANNNQPLWIGEVNVENYYKDTIPDRVIAAINKQQPINQKKLADYIARYKPSKAFIKYWTLDIAYQNIGTYYSFKENNKFGIREAYKRSKPQWDQKQDSLLTAVRAWLTSQTKMNDIKLTGTDIGNSNAIKGQVRNVNVMNNDKALASASYTYLIGSFLLREKERQWEQQYEDPKAFYQTWFNGDSVRGKKEMADPQNQLKEKIINKYFAGRSAEYLYAKLFQDAKREANPANVPEIFARFKARYPQSTYIKMYAPFVDSVISRRQRPISAEAILLPDNGSKINTFAEVLAMHKGKTVLVDMWGTWCGPCREEIEANGAAIKEHFKGKDLDYLYVANYDMTHEPEWKKLIAYFQMKGTHILANDGLNKDIMKNFKESGYPTYFIIKKDGTYELSKAGYPMKRDVLIKQLEEALAMK